MPQIQMSQTIDYLSRIALVLVIGTLDIRACFEFRALEFEFKKLALLPDRFVGVGFELVTE